MAPRASARSFGRRLDPRDALMLSPGREFGVERLAESCAALHACPGPKP